MEQTNNGYTVRGGTVTFRLNTGSISMPAALVRKLLDGRAYSYCAYDFVVKNGRVWFADGSVINLVAIVTTLQQDQST